MSTHPVAVIAGAGAGLGRALARRFAEGGCDIALLARHAEHLAPLAADVEAAGRRALALGLDVTDPVAVADGFARIRDTLGAPGVLLYNAGQWQAGGVLELTPEQFLSGFKVSCYGAFLSVREVLPGMVAARAGTVIFTGATASLRGGARFAAFASGKFGLRALAQSCAREFGPQGVHVAHVVIDGQIATPTNLARLDDRPVSSLLDPAALAETWWQLHQQPASAWTHEMDLRPAVEKF